VRKTIKDRPPSATAAYLINVHSEHMVYTLPHLGESLQMLWNECKPMDERLRFVARLLEGEKMAPLLAPPTPQRQHDAPHADAAKEQEHLHVEQRRPSHRDDRVGHD
jgi:hypothetical protein